MANYATLKTAIESTIRTNGQEEITGQILQNAIIALIESLGAEFQFAGVASTSTNPGTPDYKVMYIAGAGTYPNFGGTVVEKGHIGVFAYNGSWNNVVVETGAYFEFQEYPSGDAIEFTFYDSENTDGKTIKINKTVSGISNAPDEAISQWWAAQIQRKIQDVQGFTDNFTSLSTTEQSLGLFGIIKTGKVIDSITGVNKLIFIDDESNEYTVNTTDLPYVTPADFVSVKLQSGTASNVSINVRGDNDVLISHININEIANHPSAYTSAALALNDVPTLYRRKGMKVVYYDDTLSLWVEMLNVDDAGANWWTDVTNNWVIEGPIETELPTNTGGQQLRVGGTKRGNLDDVLNVNVWNNQATEYSSKDNARAAVPSNKRKLGAIITYLVSTGSDTSDWMIDEFIGSSISDWTEADNWKTIGPVSVSQNIETGHTDIEVGDTITSMPSLEEFEQLKDDVNGIPEITQPTTEDILSGKYLDSYGNWVEAAGYKYLMIDVRNYKGDTISIVNSSANVTQFAFLQSYDSEGCVFADGTGRESAPLSNETIPNDANYLYLFMSSFPSPVLPVLHITETRDGLKQKVSLLEDKTVLIERKIERIATTEQISDNTIINKDSDGVTEVPNHYVNYREPFLVELAGFTTYYFTVQQACKIWETSNDKVYYLAVFNNGTMSAANYIARYEQRVNNIPKVDSKLQLSEGQLVVITVQTGNEFEVTTDVPTFADVLGETVIFGEKQIAAIQELINESNNDSVNEMYVEKSATELNIYKRLGASPYYVCYNYTHRYSTYQAEAYPSFYDNWGLMNTSVVTIIGGVITTILARLFTAEAEMAINVTNPNGGYQYVGGVMHGFDNILTDQDNDRNLSIMIDNQKIGETDVVAFKPVSEVVIMYKGYLYQAYTNTNPFAIIEKKMSYSNDGVFISNNMKFLRSISVQQAQFGMMKLQRHYMGNANNPYLVNVAITNEKPFHKYIVDDDWKESGSSAGIGTLNHNVSKITEYGVMGMGFSLEVIESTLKPNGGMKVWHNGGGDAKIYFDITGAYEAQENDVLSSTVQWNIFGKPILS